MTPETKLFHTYQILAKSVMFTHGIGHVSHVSSTRCMCETIIMMMMSTVIVHDSINLNAQSVEGGVGGG